MNFDSEIEYSRAKIAAAQLNYFAVPHLVIDDVLSSNLVARINTEWPSADRFQPEVPGNHVCMLYRNSYDRLSAREREFWVNFNEEFWPALMAACAEAFVPVAKKVFRHVYADDFSLEMPLTLMQADAAYTGHGRHTHFYHCPHWAFTGLLYIDPEDTVSRGTALHHLVKSGGNGSSPTSNYDRKDIDWRVQTAMNTLKWENDGNQYVSRVADYRPNRFFLFLDGPLALHSVPFDNADHTPNPRRALNGGIHARRRILRAHTKVYHVPFYKMCSAKLPKRLTAERYMPIMAQNAVLSSDDERYRDTVIKPFFYERLTSYANGASQSSTEPEGGSAPDRSSWMNFFRKRDPDYQLLLERVRARMP